MRTDTAWMFFCLLHVLLCNGIDAQPSTVVLKQITDQDGLPNNLFRMAIQDHNGVIWMGGQDGLAKYDGLSFTAFRHLNRDTTSISGNNISKLFEDSRGRLWVATYGTGVNVSDSTKTRFRTVRFAGHDTMVVTDICEDAFHRFWLATNGGLILLEEHGESFSMVDPVSLTDDSILCTALHSPHVFLQYTEDTVLIGTEQGLCLYDSRNRRLTGPDAFPGVPVSPINCLKTDQSGKIWLSCRNEGARMYYEESPGSLRFDPLEAIRFQTTGQSIQFDFDLDNRIWITEFGSRFYGYDMQKGELFLESSVNSTAPFERFVRNPFVDHSGNVWLHGQGYLIYPYPKGFSSYFHPFAFHQSNSCIYRTGQTLWLGYRELGIVKLDLHTGEAVHFTADDPKNYIPVDHVQDILKVRSGNVIIVGFSNVSVMDQDDRLIASHVIPGTNRAVFEDSAGRIWIGGIRGLHLFDEDKGVLKTYDLPDNVGDTRLFIQKVIEDAQGNIWFASGLNGLGVLNPETEEIRQFLPVAGDIASLPSSIVEDIAIVGNTLWIGTDVGLVRFDISGSGMHTYDHGDGLQNDYVSAIVCDTKGTVWMSTHAGISSFDPDSEVFTNYTPEDGLVNYSYYSRTSLYTEEGMIYFGGSKGIDYFDPEALRKNPTAPIMYLDRVVLDNRRPQSRGSAGDVREIVVSHTNDLIEIRFAGLFYAAQSSVQYVYRMEGLSDQWVDLGTNHAALFADLKPGRYVFRARAVSPDGVWSEQDLVLPITVTPPFYQTLWFRLLAFSLLAGAAFVLIRYREKRIKRRDQQEAEVSRQITELEKRALQAQMNPHFIYNCMNSIQQFMVVHDFEGAMMYLTRFSRILRTVLNMSSQSRIPLSDEIKLIEDYLELENMRFPNKFSYAINVSPDLNVHTVEIPPFFIQPQVENAIRHGLLNKSSPGQVIVRIDKAEQQVKITVQDNGVGRMAAKSQLVRDGGPYESKALTIVRERLSHMHAHNGAQAFSITDLYDEHNHPAGTRVELFLPID